MDERDRNEFVRQTFDRVGIRLIRAAPAALDRHSLPEASRTFLAEVGLPDGAPFNMDFSLVTRLPTVSEARDEQELTAELPEVCRGWPCIAAQYGGVLTLDPRMDAAVRSIDLTANHEPLFVNSRVELLGASLAEYASLGAGSEAERKCRLEERLRAVDRAAVERADGWWRFVIEEVGYGLA